MLQRCSASFCWRSVASAPSVARTACSQARVRIAKGVAETHAAALQRLVLLAQRGQSAIRRAHRLQPGQGLDCERGRRSTCCSAAAPRSAGAAWPARPPSRAPPAARPGLGLRKGLQKHKLQRCSASFCWRSVASAPSVARTACRQARVRIAKGVAEAHAAALQRLVLLAQRGQRALRRAHRLPPGQG